MVISSEGYSEMNLRGKSQQEILKEIRSLKRKINQQKKNIEEHQPGSDGNTMPKRLTQLKYCCEYLDKAIRAYEESGGEYVPTKKEQKSMEFDRGLDDLYRLVFSIGGFFGGYETRTYTVSDDKVMLEVKHMPTLKPCDNMSLYYPFAKAEFIEGLKDVHIGEWKRIYDDPYVMDGTQWELEIQYNADKRKVQIWGSNAYPYNFGDLMRFLGMYEEDPFCDADQEN